MDDRTDINGDLRLVVHPQKVGRVRSLMQSGCDVNAKDDDLAIHSFHYAAQDEHLTILELLLTLILLRFCWLRDDIAQYPKVWICACHHSLRAYFCARRRRQAPIPTNPIRAAIELGSGTAAAVN